MAGYGICNTQNTHRQRILPPTEWKAMKDGPGYWFTAAELRKQIQFVYDVCNEVKGLCKKDEVKNYVLNYEEFLNAPIKAKQDVLEAAKQEKKNESK